MQSGPVPMQGGPVPAQQRPPAWATPPGGFASGYGAPRYGPPPPGYQPTRASNAGLIATLSVAGVVVLLVGIVGLVSLGGSSHHSTDVAYSPSPTTSESPYPTTTESSAPSTYSTTSEEPPPEGTTEDSSEEQAPTPNAPEGPHPVAKLADNPLFLDPDAGLQNLSCSLARWHTDPDAAEAFYRSAIKCLDAEWQPVLAAADLPFSSPNLQAPASGAGESPCASGTEAFAAYYCPSNNTIYMPYQTLQIDQYGAHPGVYLAVLAHEYGHHVQNLAGVMTYAQDKQYDAGGTTDAGLQYSRQLELQAQCFSGMFLGATANRGGDIDENIFTEAQNTEDRGDQSDGPRTHGTSAHAESWWNQGSKYNRTAECNTWNAKSSDVT